MEWRVNDFEEARKARPLKGSWFSFLYPPLSDHFSQRHFRRNSRDPQENGIEVEVEVASGGQQQQQKRERTFLSSFLFFYLDLHFPHPVPSRLQQFSANGIAIRKLKGDLMMSQPNPTLPPLVQHHGIQVVQRSASQHSVSPSTIKSKLL